MPSTATTSFSDFLHADYDPLNGLDFAESPDTLTNENQQAAYPEYDDESFLSGFNEKRKIDQDGSLKDSINKSIKSSSSTTPGPTGVSPTSSSGIGKKPGRKLATAEPANKRKAQNRAAQRAFRERKERHLKDLEDRVNELENEAKSTHNENEFLKLQVEKLQAELKKYRGSRPLGSLSSDEKSPASNTNSSKPFTFEFPFFQSNETKKTSISQSDSTSPLSMTNPSPLSSTDSPFSTGTSASNSSNNSNTSNTTPIATSGNGLDSKRFMQNEEEESFCDNLSLACGTRDHPVPKAKPSTISNIAKSPSTLKSSTTSPQSKDTSSLFSPLPFDFDFLGATYRDPLFDSADFTLPEIATSEYSMMDPIDNPLVDSTFSNMTDMMKNYPSNPVKSQHVEEEEEETVPAYPSKMMTCSAVWDRISSHPKFNDLDIDGLCSELQSKAKCSETGVLLTERDVDNVLAGLG